MTRWVKLEYYGYRSTRVCLGPKTIITHMHLTIVALNYHFATVCSTCTACPGSLCTAVMKALTPKHPPCLLANMHFSHSGTYYLHLHLFITNNPFVPSSDHSSSILPFDQPVPNQHPLQPR